MRIRGGGFLSRASTGLRPMGLELSGFSLRGFLDKMSLEEGEWSISITSSTYQKTFGGRNVWISHI